MGGPCDFSVSPMSNSFLFINFYLTVGTGAWLGPGSGLDNFIQRSTFLMLGRFISVNLIIIVKLRARSRSGEDQEGQSQVRELKTQRSQ